MAFESWEERARELEGDVYALGMAIRDDRTPLAAKVVTVLVVGYAVSPIDPIPDFLPGYVFTPRTISPLSRNWPLTHR